MSPTLAITKAKEHKKNAEEISVVFCIRSLETTFDNFSFSLRGVGGGGSIQSVPCFSTVCRSMSSSHDHDSDLLLVTS